MKNATPRRGNKIMQTNILTDDDRREITRRTDYVMQGWQGGSHGRNYWIEFKRQTESYLYEKKEGSLTL